MDCPKGSICKETEHKVKTLDKAVQWYESTVDCDLPITVRQITASNGRTMIKVHNRFGKLIHQRG